MVVDPSGTYFRREGYTGHFVAGRAPALEEEPNVENLDVDYTYFDNTVYPVLAHRVPGFKDLKVIARSYIYVVFSSLLSLN